VARPADPARDAAACAAVYAPAVTDGFASFEAEPPEAGEMAVRIGGAHAWFVAERDGAVTVACDSAVLAHELDLMSELVVGQLNATLGRPAVKRLRTRATRT